MTIIKSSNDVPYSTCTRIGRGTGRHTLHILLQTLKQLRPMAEHDELEDILHYTTQLMFSIERHISISSIR